MMIATKTTIAVKTVLHCGTCVLTLCCSSPLKKLFFINSGTRPNKLANRYGLYDQPETGTQMDHRKSHERHGDNNRRTQVDSADFFKVRLGGRFGGLVGGCAYTSTRSLTFLYE